jgi:hypothetical protein
MVTTAQEYWTKLHLVLNENPPTYALLPSAENIYNIDVNSRTVDAPPFLAIEGDHKSETIYFIVDRYVDYIDLSTMCCMISYVNAKNESRVYQVPFYDIYTYAAQGKILVPWCLDATVAATAGVVQFSIQFYRVGEIINSDGLAEKVLNYSLNTLPARSVVLEGMEVGEVDSSYLLTASQFQILSDAIQKIDALNDIYWTVLTE